MASSSSSSTRVSGRAVMLSLIKAIEMAAQGVVGEHDDFVFFENECAAE
jgi:hypothetical protein